MTEKTDSESDMGAVLLLFHGLYVSSKAPPDLLVNVMGTILTLCHVVQIDAITCRKPLSINFCSYSLVDISC